MPLIPLLLSLAAPAQPALTREILDEINFARQHPREYAETLREYRTLFHGRIVYYPNNPIALRTEEGVAAVDEAIRFLEKQAPLEPIEASRLFARAAADHVGEQGARGAVGHFSQDGAKPSDRVLRRGGGIYVAEVITYGPSSAAEVVRQLIVDDAVPGRGHRTTLFSADMRYAGVACGPHRTYRMMCVADLGRTPDGRPQG